MDTIRTLPDDLIQIAGIHDLEEAQLLLEEGTDLIGIPLRLTVNAEDLSTESAASISGKLPGKCCLITYLSNPSEIVSLVEYLQVSWLQLHGPVDPRIFPELHRRIPRVGIIKSLVIGKSSLNDLESEIAACGRNVSAFITDTYDSGTGAEGATGLTHDWNISRRIREQARCPVILAGGLHPGNVASAIHSVHPGGVDVHTGVEDASGRKSRELVRDFVRTSRSAFDRLAPPG